jgi:hypothetical protein
LWPEVHEARSWDVQQIVAKQELESVEWLAPRKEKNPEPQEDVKSRALRRKGTVIHR